MAHGVIFVALLLSTVATSLQKHLPQNTDDEYDDDYYDDPEPISESREIEDTEELKLIPAKDSKGIQKQNIRTPKILKADCDREELTTAKQVAKYEVTELVEDVPDVNTRRVPVITNFTLTRPLNFAGVPSNNTNNIGGIVKDEGDEIINSILIPEKPKVIINNQVTHVKGSNNKFDSNDDDHDDFSNLHPKDSFEEQFNKEFGSDEDHFDDLEAKEETKPSKGFKDHFQDFKKSIVNEFESVVNKHKDGIHDSLRKIVNGPISFFNKLHRKSTDLAKKLHKAVSRHKHHDEDDDVGFHEVDHDFEDN